MHMKPEQVKKLLLAKMHNVTKNPQSFCVNPKTDFSRNRKLSMEKVVGGIIGMKSGSLNNELLDMFDLSINTPTTSAFVQQRNKIKPEAFETIFKEFSQDLVTSFEDDIHVLAVDGSKIQIATDPSDVESFFPGNNGQKSYNLLHLNGLFHLGHRIYDDVIIQKARQANEHKALIEMIERSKLRKAIVIADRGYESYNTLAHIQEKGWFFLFRIKDGAYGIKNGLELPETASYDLSFVLNLTRKQTKETKELFKDRNHYRFVPATTELDYLPKKCRKSQDTKFYKFSFRIVRFPISENVYESIITNLPEGSYPPERIKELYASRWGIETSFRDLKYTMGMLNFHSKKVMCIQQEIYAHLIMYNFAEMITSHVVINKKQRRYTYKANFSIAAHMCILFYQGKTTSPNLEAIIAKNLIPIRFGRHRERNQSVKRFHGFLYRVA